MVKESLGESASTNKTRSLQRTKKRSLSCPRRTSCPQATQVVKNGTIRIPLKRNFQKDLFLTEYFTRSLKVRFCKLFHLKKKTSLTLPCSDFSLSPDGNHGFLSATFPRMNHGCGRRGVWGKVYIFHFHDCWAACFTCPFCSASSNCLHRHPWSVST